MSAFVARRHRPCLPPISALAEHSAAWKKRELIEGSWEQGGVAQVQEDAKQREVAGKILQPYSNV